MPLEWITQASSGGKPKKSSHRIYIPMGFAGFLFNCGEADTLLASLGARQSIATSGLAVCVGLILYHESTHSGMVAHFDSDNVSRDYSPPAGAAAAATADTSREMRPSAPAKGICVSMIKRFIARIPESKGTLLAKICGNPAADPTTANIIDQLEKALTDRNVKYEIKTGDSMDIYLNLVTGEAGIYSESFRTSERIVLSTASAFDEEASVRRTFPETENFEFYQLTYPMTQDPLRNLSIPFDKEDGEDDESIIPPI